MDWSAIHNSLTSLSFYVMLWLQWGQTTNIFILLCKISLNQLDEFTLWLEVIKRVLVSIVGTSLASRKMQDFTLQDLSRKTLVARLARQKFT